MLRPERHKSIWSCHLHEQRGQWGSNHFPSFHICPAKYNYWRSICGSKVISIIISLAQYFWCKRIYFRYERRIKSATEAPEVISRIVLFAITTKWFLGKHHTIKGNINKSRMRVTSNIIALVDAAALVSPIAEIAQTCPAPTELANMIISDNDSGCQILARKKNESLPRVLMKFLEDESNSDILSWNSNGDGFFVVNTNRFLAGPMRKHFKITRFSTFVEKLFQWGFVPLEGRKRNFAFCHPNFHRGDWVGCHMIQCNTKRPKNFFPAEVASQSCPRLVTSIKPNPEKHCSPITSLPLSPKVDVPLDKMSLEVKCEVSRNITHLPNFTRLPGPKVYKYPLV